jgi:hypothetical protein
MKFDDVLKAFQAEKEKALDKRKSMLDECNLMLAICEKYLKKLRQAVFEKGFERKKQEVRFFKHIKPLIVSDFFFYLEARPVEISFLNLCDEANKELLLKKIAEISGLLRKNSEFLHYINGGYTRLDKGYFTVQKDVLIPNDNRIYFVDPEFSTSHSGLLAKLMACRRLLPHLNRELNSVGQKGKMSVSTSGKLHWTSAKVDLVELIYALHLTGSIGDGKSHLKELVNAFESLFNIEILEPYKIFSEVKNRQKSKTKFLDELAVNLQKYIHENC